MSPRKFDGVIEAVRYNAEGRVEQVRLYERRGAVFSDCVLLGRDDLVGRLKARKIFVAGQRKLWLGSSFTTGAQVHLAGPAGKEVIVTANPPAGRDDLKGVPEY